MKNSSGEPCQVCWDDEPLPSDDRDESSGSQSSHPKVAASTVPAYGKKNAKHLWQGLPWVKLQSLIEAEKKKMDPRERSMSIRG